MRSPGLAGMFRVAWKILRGAVVASSASVTVGAVAHHAELAKTATQTAPKVLESFILSGLPCSRSTGSQLNAAGLKTIAASEYGSTELTRCFQALVARYSQTR